MMSTNEPASTTPPPSDPMARVALGIEVGSKKILDGFKAETESRATERRVMTAVLAVGFVSVLGVQSCLVQKSSANAARIAGLVTAVEEQRADLRTLVATTEQTQESVEEAKADVAASPRIEALPPSKPGGPPRAQLVVPARPSKAATTATPSAAAVPSSAPAPSVVIPIPLPSATVVVGSTSGGE